jgi:hypothetical protein
MRSSPRTSGPRTGTRPAASQRRHIPPLPTPSLDQEDEDQLLKIADVVRDYRLSRASLYKLMAAGRLRWTQVVGIKGRRISRAAITALLETRGGWAIPESTHTDN